MSRKTLKIKEKVRSFGAVWTLTTHSHRDCGCMGMDEHCTKGVFVQQKVKHNLVPDILLEALAKQFVNAHTYDIGDNLYIAIGTDATPPAAGDTTLGAEEQRKSVGSQSASGAQFNVTAFFNAGEVAGNTYEEYGFITSGGSLQASGTVDTGVLASHVTDTMIVGELETLTVSFNFTITR